MTESIRCFEELYKNIYFCAQKIERIKHQAYQNHYPKKGHLVQKFFSEKISKFGQHTLDKYFGFETNSQKIIRLKRKQTQYFQKILKLNISQDLRDAFLNDIVFSNRNRILQEKISSSTNFVAKNFYNLQSNQRSLNNNKARIEKYIEKEKQKKISNIDMVIKSYRLLYGPSALYFDFHEAKVSKKYTYNYTKKLHLVLQKTKRDLAVARNRILTGNVLGSDKPTDLYHEGQYILLFENRAATLRKEIIVNLPKVRTKHLSDVENNNYKNLCAIYAKP